MINKIASDKNRIFRTLSFRCWCVLTVLLFSCLYQIQPSAHSETYSIQEPECRAAIVMEASSGDVAYALNEHEPLPPASMVKMMVILLVSEKIEQGSITWTDTVKVSANASKMGGSQVYLKQGEEFTIQELLEAVIIQSANDASISLAEYIGGSAKGFVDMMNAKAASLNMKHTRFHTPHGLPPSKGQEPDMSSAYDLALLAREIVTKYPDVLKWSSTETQEFRDGAFKMYNTNHLIRDFQGCDGIKTGYYKEAGFCVTATAMRNDIRIITVVMGCEKSKQRFREAARLLSYGFDQYVNKTIAEKNEPIDQSIPVISGVKSETIPVLAQAVNTIARKNDPRTIAKRITLVKELRAPVQPGQECGFVTFIFDGRDIGTAPLVTNETIEELGFWGKLFN
ncbi:D-alanyl-D-alanine carboxypeptidase [bacterium]|nr:D-alanyl-D-alanine carboxypeptidase [candidate division CSSED10-310 bacterium]